MKKQLHCKALILHACIPQCHHIVLLIILCFLFLAALLCPLPCSVILAMDFPFTCVGYKCTEHSLTNLIEFLENPFSKPLAIFSHFYTA